jgi:hypothetical protein
MFPPLEFMDDNAVRQLTNQTMPRNGIITLPTFQDPRQAKVLQYVVFFDALRHCTALVGPGRAIPTVITTDNQFVVKVLRVFTPQATRVGAFGRATQGHFEQAARSIYMQTLALEISWDDWNRMSGNDVLLAARMQAMAASLMNTVAYEALCSLVDQAGGIPMQGEMGAFSQVHFAHDVIARMRTTFNIVRNINNGGGIVSAVSAAKLEIAENNADQGMALDPNAVIATAKVAGFVNSSDPRITEFWKHGPGNQSNIAREFRDIPIDSMTTLITMNMPMQRRILNAPGVASDILSGFYTLAEWYPMWDQSNGRPLQAIHVWDYASRREKSITRGACIGEIIKHAAHKTTEVGAGKRVKYNKDPVASQPYGAPRLAGDLDATAASLYGVNLGAIEYDNAQTNGVLVALQRAVDEYATSMTGGFVAAAFPGDSFKFPVTDRHVFTIGSGGVGENHRAPGAGSPNAAAAMALSYRYASHLAANGITELQLAISNDATRNQEYNVPSNLASLLDQFRAFVDELCSSFPDSLLLNKQSLFNWSNHHELNAYDMVWWLLFHPTAAPVFKTTDTEPDDKPDRDVIVNVLKEFGNFMGVAFSDADIAKGSNAAMSIKVGGIDVGINATKLTKNAGVGVIALAKLFKLPLDRTTVFVQQQIPALLASTSKRFEQTSKFWRWNPGFFLREEVKTDNVDVKTVKIGDVANLWTGVAGDEDAFDAYFSLSTIIDFWAESGETTIADVAAKFKGRTARTTTAGPGNIFDMTSSFDINVGYFANLLHESVTNPNMRKALDVYISLVSAPLYQLARGAMYFAAITTPVAFLTHVRAELSRVKIALVRPNVVFNTHPIFVGRLFDENVCATYITAPFFPSGSANPMNNYGGTSIRMQHATVYNHPETSVILEAAFIESVAMFGGTEFFPYGTNTTLLSLENKRAIGLLPIVVPEHVEELPDYMPNGFDDWNSLTKMLKLTQHKIDASDMPVIDYALLTALKTAYGKNAYNIVSLDEQTHLSKRSHARQTPVLFTGPYAVKLPSGHMQPFNGTSPITHEMMSSPVTSWS